MARDKTLSNQIALLFIVYTVAIAGSNFSLGLVTGMIRAFAEIPNVAPI